MQNFKTSGVNVNTGAGPYAAGELVIVGSLVGVAAGGNDVIVTQGIFDLAAEGTAVLGDVAYADADRTVSKTKAAGSYRVGTFMGPVVGGFAPVRLDGVAVIAEA